MEQVLLIGLGWLLGLLGGPLAERIRRRYRAEELRRACLGELKELRYTMASLVYLIHSRQGDLNRALLEWIDPIESSYEGPDSSPEEKETWRKIRALKPEELARVADRRSEDLAMNVKVFSLPFLEARMSDLPLLSVELQQGIHQVRHHLDLFNQDVAVLQGQFALTFQALPTENHARVRKNLTDGYKNLAKRATIIADAITPLVS
jgi:hypothetical protein